MEEMQEMEDRGEMGEMKMGDDFNCERPTGAVQTAISKKMRNPGHPISLQKWILFSKLIAVGIW